MDAGVGYTILRNLGQKHHTTHTQIPEEILAFISSNHERVNTGKVL